MPSDHGTVVPGPPTFTPIPPEERLADKVATTLMEAIFRGDLAVGTKLPAERTLCEQLGVSRPVVREAVRSLHAKGMLTEHPRRGHVVSMPPTGAVTESLQLVIRGRRFDYRKVAEVRDVLEVATASRAAVHATDEQVAEVVRIAGLLHVDLDAADAAVADVDFHRSVAVATGNEFFVVLLDSMREVLVEVQLPTLAVPAIRRTARRAHEAIAAAIAARDADAAREAMRAHLELAQRQMRELVSSSGGVVEVGG